MKIGFVVQRYGLEVNGGAELHCRWVAEHMGRHFQAEVLTTTALDYITWKNYYPEGTETVNGIPVRRFRVLNQRDPIRFGKLQNMILNEEHSLDDELQWLDEEGPYAPEMIRYIKDNETDYDGFIFFSYRYYHSYHGIRAVPQKSLMVPTAENDGIIRLGIFRELFQLPRALIYNSPEERNLIQSAAGNIEIPEDVVGVGIELSEHPSEKEFRKRSGIEGSYILYVGRIDENKGCRELFDYFLRFKEETGSPVKLVLVGSTKLMIPDHRDIKYLGFLSEENKFSALSGADLLVMPSFYESLSMVTLEAWALGKPVLANGRCDVLRGQCIRSRAGLYYQDYMTFKKTLALMLERPSLRTAQGESGRDYFRKNYSWEVIEKKYLNLLSILKKER